MRRVQIIAPAGSAITIQVAKLWWYEPASTSGATVFANVYANWWVNGRHRTTP